LTLSHGTDLNTNQKPQTLQKASIDGFLPVGQCLLCDTMIKSLGLQHFAPIGFAQVARLIP
jgi:hypothetical protein